jgi:F-type H+-transporting ATPase subunit b
MRKLFAAALLAGGLVVVAGSTAHAQDPGEKADEHVYECIVEAQEEHGLLTEEGGAVPVDDATKEQLDDFENALEDCKKAPSLLTPALAEIIWGAIAFGIVVFVLMKFAFPALKKGLKDREEKIRQDLEAAEHAREEALAEKARYEQSIAEARGEANRIVETAREDAERVRTELTARAESEAAETRRRAEEDVRLVTERAMGDLQRRVADLSIELAEKIVERNLDPETQRALVESYIASVGSGNGTRN